ncbi:MAG: hypothetical protein HY692_08700 [Cyanobacteria bacterium NC_groundwater_1444_Ag_S-0.65um_54_12]|nr:hypothetical protein [Cyanobacteria bacterium NC_groundwater_1444_Ag_S-0.65um_54_12]
MARRTSFFLSATMIVAVAGCATNSPVTREVSGVPATYSRNLVMSQAQQQQADYGSEQAKTSQQQQAGNSSEQVSLAQQVGFTQMAQPPVGLQPGMRLPTTPLTSGALPIPSITSMAPGIPAAIPAAFPTAMNPPLTLFPTAAFAAFRWIDLYLPLFATSVRTAAILGVPSGLTPSVLSRLHFFGVGSHFGFALPYHVFHPYFWHVGAFRPFFMYANGLYNYPFFASIHGSLTPFTYTSPSLLAPWSAAGVTPGITPGVLPGSVGMNGLTSGLAPGMLSGIARANGMIASPTTGMLAGNVSATAISPETTVANGSVTNSQ